MRRQSGYRGRRSHAVVPISECPIAAPLLVDAAMAAAEILRRMHQRPAEISLFCDATETQLLVSIITANPAKDRLTILHARLTSEFRH